MRYQRAYRFVLEQRDWPMICLAGTLCQMVPVLGQIVFTGYLFEWLASFRADDEGPLPAFDLDRIPIYMTRGLWPVVVQMIALLPLLLLSGVTLFLLWAAVDRSAALTPRLLLAALAPVTLGLVVLVSVVLTPLTLHVGFRQEWGPDALAFARVFLQRVGRETLLAQLFIAVTSMTLLLLGFFLCCVPAFTGLALTHLAQYHLLAQLYELYRQRGGAPVPAGGASKPA